MARYTNEELEMTREDAITEIEMIRDIYKEMRKEYETCVKALDMAIDALNLQPTCNQLATNLQPNVRGEWIEDELGTTVCSNCKNPRRDNRIKHIAFCNSCGADMRGEE